MVRGIQRQMVKIKTSESRYFEEAYFLLKPDVGSTRGRETDMIAEANRILSESGLYDRKNGGRGAGEGGGRGAKKGRSGEVSGLPALLFGILCGGGFVGLFWILTALF